MALTRLPGVALTLLLFLIGLPLAQAQGQKSPSQEGELSRIQKLLDKQTIDPNQFQADLPLEELLKTLTKRLFKELILSLRIDKDAFGSQAEEVAATPITLPPSEFKTSLRSVLQLAMAKSKIKIDYRIDDWEVVITTPQKALYIASYDIRDILARPEVLLYGNSPHPNAQPEHKYTKNIIQGLVNCLQDLLKLNPNLANGESLEVRNGNLLIIHTNAAKHADVTALLDSFRRLGGVAVIVETKLYEVDEAFFTKVKNLKRFSLDEQDTKGINPEEDALFKVLDKYKKIQEGEKLMVIGCEVFTVLSRHKTITCLPSPEQLHQGDKRRQAILEGITLQAAFKVSPNRRSVRVDFTEKGTALQELKKEKTWTFNKKDGQEVNEEVDAETPFLLETTHSKVLEISDGWSVLVPVVYRDTSARAKDRWWVLCITPRIYIEEEELLTLRGSVEGCLPEVVADILTNPGIKIMRELCGTPGDTRFALVNSSKWSWPETLRLKIPGQKWVHADKKGIRLLGIRVDSYQWEEFDSVMVLAVTLVNAGGSDNGSAVGSCTIRYKAKSTEKGWKVEILE